MQRFSISQFLDSDDKGVAAELNRLPTLPFSSIAVLGGHRTARQSICMHMAWYTARQGKRVLFLSDKLRMTRSRLLLPMTSSTTDQAWAMIGMRYLSGREEFVKYVCSVHAMPGDSIPDLVVVDDDSDLLTPANTSSDGRERSLAASVALLKDGIDHLQSRTGKVIQLVLGMPPKARVPLYILWRWIPAAIELHQLGSPPKGSATSLPVGSSNLCCLTITPGPQAPKKRTICIHTDWRMTWQHQQYNIAGALLPYIRRSSKHRENRIALQATAALEAACMS